MKMEECKTCKTFIYLAVIDYKRHNILTCKILKEVRIWEALLWPFPINQCGIYRKCSLIIIIHTLLQSHTHLYYGAENAAIKNHCNLFIVSCYTMKIWATFVSTQVVVYPNMLGEQNQSEKVWSFCQISYSSNLRCQLWQFIIMTDWIWCVVLHSAMSAKQ